MVLQTRAISENKTKVVPVEFSRSNFSNRAFVRKEANFFGCDLSSDVEEELF